MRGGAPQTRPQILMKTLNPTKVIDWVGGLGGNVNLSARHATRPALWCARSIDIPLNPKPLNPKPLNPKPLNPKPLNLKPLNPKPLNP